MKQTIWFSLFLLGLALVAFMGCREDVLIDEEPPVETPTEQPGEFFSTELNGLVQDERGQVIQNATIIVDGKTLTTDEFGFFTAAVVEAPSTGLYIKALKEGYFSGGTHFFTSAPSASAVIITLLQKELRTFDAAEGYEGELSGGATVLIPSGAIERNGQDYTGTVKISSVWLNPEEESTFETMPGALLAQTQSGETQTLQTFGMIAVEMTDDQGQDLQLKEGSMAELSFPLSSEMQNSAPQTIPLWHFDETVGIWREEGQAEQINGEYIAQVSHFSWWNCDIPFDITKLCLEIEDQRGNTLDNLTPCLFGDNGFGSCNPRNQYCGLIPANMTFTLELRDDCNNTVHTELIGPFTGTINDVTILAITLSPQQVETLSFTGNLVDCNGASVTSNAVVSVNIDNNNFYDFSVDNGEYSVNVIRCSSSTDQVLITAFDLDNLESGETTVDLVDGQIDYQADLTTCGTSFSELLTIEFSTGNFVIEDVSAFQSTAETLIAARLSTNTSIDKGVLIGFKGTGVGQFAGNIILNEENTGAAQGLADQATINITRYDDVGGLIVGDFVEGPVSGTFFARRQR